MILGRGGAGTASTAAEPTAVTAAEGAEDERTTSRKEGEPSEHSEPGLSQPHRSCLERPRENRGGEEVVADGEKLVACATEEEVAGGLGVSSGGRAVGDEATGEGETLGIPLRVSL